MAAIRSFNQITPELGDRVYVDPATPDELTRLGGDHLYRYFA